MDWNSAEEEARDLATCHLLIHGALDAPAPLDVIAKSLGIVIISRPCWPDPDFTGVAVVGADMKLVIVNSLLPDGRKAFTVAHEIGHIAMEHTGPRSLYHERLANVYASELLMPTCRIAEQIGVYGPDAAVLAKLNCVSFSAMQRRIQEVRDGPNILFRRIANRRAGGGGTDH